MVAQGRLSFLYKTQLDLCTFRFLSDLYFFVFIYVSNLHRKKDKNSGSSMVQKSKSISYFLLYYRTGYVRLFII